MWYVRAKKILASFFLPLFLAGILSSCGFFGIGSAFDDDEKKPSKAAAFVFAVGTTAEDGTYGPGAVIPVVVTFTKQVIVEGTPQLSLNTGAGETVLDYVEGSTTNALVFLYTVAPGDFSTDLDYSSKTALTLNGGKIKGPEQEDAVLTLVEPGAGRSLSAGADIVIDTVGPTVASVSSTASNGTFGTGHTVPITVTFSEVVNVTGTPQLTLATGSVVDYVSGGGTATLLFNYVVQAGQNSADLDYASTSSLSLNGGTITDIYGNAGVTDLPAPGATGSLADSKDLVIDTIQPTVTLVSSTTADGSYRAGQTVAITLTFSEAVTVTGTPRLTLETGSTDAVVNYTSGSTTSTLTFNYTVASGENSVDLNYGATNALALNGGTIRDSIGNDAVLDLPAVAGASSLAGTKAIVIDTIGPTVTNVTSTTDGTHKIGDVIPITVTFSEAVTVTGTPRLTLATGGAGTAVDYVSAAPSTTMTFNYTVAQGDVSADLDYVTSAALALNSGTIRDAVGNDATVLLPDPGQAGSLGANRALVIDGIRPAVTSVSATTVNGSYTTGQTVTVTVTFDDTVTVTGTPQITLATGGAGTAVDYVVAGPSTTISFDYLVGAGENSADLDYAAVGSLVANGGTLRDASGNDAILNLPSPSAAGSLGANRNIVIDTLAPTVTNVTSSTANGSYRAGQSVLVQVTFSEPITVTGTPQLTLATGGGGTVVNFTSSTGATLTFDYTIAGGDTSTDLDYAAIGSLALNGGTIRDALNIAADLALPAPAATGSLGANKAIIVDTTAPTVTNVTSSTANGSFGIGGSISIQVQMSEVVNVVGTPTLTLETGATDRAVNYVSGTGTSTLNFTYTVSEGDASSDLNYLSTGALSAGGGIADVAGNSADRTLPGLAAAGALAVNKALVVDGVRPTVSSVSSSAANGTYGIGQTLPITVTFSEAVTVSGSPTLTLETGTSNAVVSLTSGSGTNILTFDYTVGVNDSATDLDYVDSSALAAGGTIRDSVGNDATLTLADPGQPGSLGDNRNIVITTPATGLTINGTDNSGRAGYAVAVVGDMNGDGKADYAIGEPFAQVGGTEKGRVKVYSGENDAVLFTFNGAETGSAFGFAVAAAGDVNHDGRADIIIGAPLFNGSGTDRGKVYIYSGATGTQMFQVTGTENNAQLGFSVGSAGDVNRDGKIDFLVGEPLANAGGTDRGKAYVYSGANGTVVLKTITGTENNAQLGYAVASAGDVNRDGRGDYIVGEPFASNGGTARGVAHVYSGTNGAELLSLDCTEEDNAHCGASVAAIGDVNRDGFTDVVVGEPLADGGGTNRGKAFVYDGSTGTALFTVTGAESNAQLGYAVAGAGDVNRDGRPDLIVGEPFADNGGTDRGKSYVHSGATGGVLYTLAGTENDAELGFAVAGGGDFNRDGKADFLVGASLAEGSGTDAGAAIRYTSGFTTLPVLDPTLAYTVTGAEDGAELGSYVANLGDIDGDSYDDFLVAEPKSGDDQGTVYVYSGATGAIKYTKSGSGENGAQYGYSAGGGGDLDGDGKNDFIVGEPFTAAGGKVWVYSGADGHLLSSLESSEPGSQLGSSVAIVGDVNGDSKDDVIVSEPAADNGGTDRGIAYVISGADGTTALHIIGGTIDSDFLGDKVAAAGDVDGDGKADFMVATSNNDDGAADGGLVVVYSGSTGDVINTISGSEASARSGFSIAGAGDVDGDGRADYIVGSPGSAAGGTSRGRVRVYSGAAGTVLYDIAGTLNNAMLGYAVSGAGDVNGDGKADFIMGAPFVNDVGSERGRVYLYSGSSGASLYSITGQFDSAHLGQSVGGGGDANGDGKSDFLMGEPGAENAGTNRGNAYFYLAPSN